MSDHEAETPVQAARTQISGVKPPSPLLLGSEARQDWVRWQEDWSDYSIIQDIPAKPVAMQLALLRMALGPEGRKLLRHQPTPMFRDEHGDEKLMDENHLETIIKMMEIAVNGEVNDTFERYVFRHRLQKEGETFDEFLTELRESRKRCDFCDCMRDKLLKDQVITGVRDTELRERLLQQRGLSLTKCIDMCRAAESASSQAKEMGQAAAAEVNWVQYKGGYKGGYRAKSGPAGPRPPNSTGTGYRGHWNKCQFCGRHHPLTPGVCSALGKRCNKCNGLNHFSAMCPPPAVNQVNPDDTGDPAYAPRPVASDTDIGAINWIGSVSPHHKARLRVQGRDHAFLLDTGATANLLSSHDVDVSKFFFHMCGKP